MQNFWKILRDQCSLSLTNLFPSNIICSNGPSIWQWCQQGYFKSQSHPNSLHSHSQQSEHTQSLPACSQNSKEDSGPSGSHRNNLEHTGPLGLCRNFANSASGHWFQPSHWKTLHNVSCGLTRHFSHSGDSSPILTMSYLSSSSMLNSRQQHS